MCLWPKILTNTSTIAPKQMPRGIDERQILVHQNNLNLTPELKIKYCVSSAHQIEQCSLVTKGNMGW